MLPLDQVGEHVLHRPPAPRDPGPRHLTRRQKRQCLVERRALDANLGEEVLLAKSPAHVLVPRGSPGPIMGSLSMRLPYSYRHDRSLRYAFRNVRQ